LTLLIKFWKNSFSISTFWNRLAGTVFMLITNLTFILWESDFYVRNWISTYLKIVFWMLSAEIFFKIYRCTYHSLQIEILGFDFCVLKKWVHSRIGQCVRPSVRPSVYTITLHNYIRLSWNFVHRIVSSISRSSSKMRMIRQEMAELSKKLSLLTRPSLRGSTGICSKKIFFSELFIQGFSKE
jgi:hypothetical protein